MVVAHPVGPKHFLFFLSFSSPLLRQCQMAVGCRRKGIDALTFLDRKTPLFGQKKIRSHFSEYPCNAANQNESA